MNDDDEGIPDPPALQREASGKTRTGVVRSGSKSLCQTVQSVDGAPVRPAGVLRSGSKSLCQTVRSDNVASVALPRIGESGEGGSSSSTRGPRDSASATTEATLKLKATLVAGSLAECKQGDTGTDDAEVRAVHSEECAKVVRVRTGGKRLRRLETFVATKAHDAKVSKGRDLRRQQFQSLPSFEVKSLYGAFEQTGSSESTLLDRDRVMACLTEIGLNGSNGAERNEVLRICSEVVDVHADGSLGGAGTTCIDFIEFAVTVVPRARLRLAELRHREIFKRFFQADANEDGILTYGECELVAGDFGIDRRMLWAIVGDHNRVEGFSFEYFQQIIAKGKEKLERAVRNREIEVKQLTGLDDRTFQHFRKDIVLLQDLFYQYDMDQSGTLNHNEIMLMLKEFGLMPRTASERTEIEQILLRADDDGNGEICFQEFLVLIRDIRKLRRDLHAEEHVYFFELYDKDRSGFLCIPEISMLLSHLGVAPKNRSEQEELAHLISSADDNCSGTICFAEFQVLCQLIDEKLNRMRYEEDIEIAMTLGFSEVQLRDFRWVFDSLDMDGSGRLDCQEVQLGLTLMQKTVPADVVQSIFEQLDEDCSGCLDFREFLELMRFLRDKDGYFSEDPQKLASRARFLETRVLRRLLEYFHLGKVYLVSLSKDELVETFCEYMGVNDNSDLHEMLGISTVRELYELARKKSGVK